jgi:hypothetical protein
VKELRVTLLRPPKFLVGINLLRSALILNPLDF